MPDSETPELVRFLEDFDEVTADRERLSVTQVLALLDAFGKYKIATQLERLNQLVEEKG